MAIIGFMNPLRQFLPLVALRDIIGPIDVTVVCQDDASTWLAAASRSGEYEFDGVTDMVDTILKALGHRKMRRLTIVAHGTSIWLDLGSNKLRVSTLAAHAASLSRLSGCFASDGHVVLEACDVGRISKLMTGMARVLSVPVFGHTGRWHGVFRVGHGKWRMAWPHGVIKYCDSPI